MTSVDNQVHKAIKQIAENPGGIILDYENNNNDILYEDIINRRIVRSSGKAEAIDVIIKTDGKLIKIIRCGRNKESAPQT